MRRQSLIAFAAAVVVAAAHVAGAAVAEPPAGRPTAPTLAWPAAQALLERHFASLGLLPTDLISRSEAATLLAVYKKKGWEVAGYQELLARVPDDGSFLVQLLRKPDSLAFMRKVGGFPDGYDRVDRLSRMPRGETILKDLVRNPGGYELIQYMTESKWGKNLGKQLGHTRDGRGFNKPTGQIYTPQALLVELKARYDQATRSK